MGVVLKEGQKETHQFWVSMGPPIFTHTHIWNKIVGYFEPSWALRIPCPQDSLGNVDKYDQSGLDKI